jgi:hypothetical protein
LNASIRSPNRSAKASGALSNADSKFTVKNVKLENFKNVAHTINNKQFNMQLLKLNL